MQELINVAIIDNGMALNSSLVCSALITAGLSKEEKGLFVFDETNEINPNIYINHYLFIAAAIDSSSASQSTKNTLQHSHICLAIVDA